jgi:hypothetical protein
MYRFSDAGNAEAIDTRWRPASEKRQGTKSRSVVQRDGEKAHCFSAVQKVEDGPQRSRWRLPGAAAFGGVNRRVAQTLIGTLRY